MYYTKNKKRNNTLIMISKIQKNLLNLLILLSLFVILYILISGGQTLYISNVKIRLNHLHNPLLIFSMLFALRLSLFKDQEFLLNTSVIKFSHNYSEFVSKNTKKELLLYFLIIVFFSTFCYLRMFNNYFIRSDFELLEEVIKTNSNFLDIFSLRFSNLFRPFFNLLFLLNYKLSGLNPIGYYIVNYLIHIGNSLLLFYFTYILTKSRFISFLAALLFAVNFDHYQAVMWISGRPGLGAAMLYLFTLIFFSRYLILNNKAIYMASVVTFGLSLLFYEGTVTLLPMMFLYDIIFHKRFNISNLQRFIKKYGVFIILLIIYVIFQFYIQSGGPHQKGIAFNLHFLYGILRSTITINEWIIPLLILSVIFQRNNITFQSLKDLLNNPVIIFSFMWIIIALFPFSFFQERSIVPSRYFYIPSIGSSILLSFLIYQIYQTGVQSLKTTNNILQNKFKATLIITTLVIILANTLATYQQEQFFGKKPDWRKIITTLKTQYNNFPDNSRIYFMNISTREIHVKALMHVFFNPTLKTFSSKTSKINIQKNDQEKKEKIFVFDYVDGKIINRTSDYIYSDPKRNPYP